MAMGMAGGMRTIWISLRALNYTSGVFNEVIKSIGKLMGHEMALNKAQMQQIQTNTRMIMAGMMFVTIAGTLAQSLWNVAGATVKGAMEMASLRQEMELAKVALADTIYDFLKWTGILGLLNSILEELQRNPTLRLLILGVSLLTIALLGLVGIVFVVQGAFGVLTPILGVVIPAMTGTTMTTVQLASAMTYLKIASVGAFAAFAAGFIIFLALKDVLGVLPAALIAVALAVAIMAISLWQAAGAMSVLTWGMAAIAGGLAIAGAVAATASAIGGMGRHPMGTRSAAYTGPHFVEKGEVIYNPSTGRPTQIGNDLEREGRSTTTIYEMPITMEHVHTKADIDDVDEVIQKRLGRRMKGRK